MIAQKVRQLQILPFLRTFRDPLLLQDNAHSQITSITKVTEDYFQQNNVDLSDWVDDMLMNASIIQPLSKKLLSYYLSPLILE